MQQQPHHIRLLIPRRRLSGQEEHVGHDEGHREDCPPPPSLKAPLHLHGVPSKRETKEWPQFTPTSHLSIWGRRIPPRRCTSRNKNTPWKCLLLLLNKKSRLLEMTPTRRAALAGLPPPTARLRRGHFFAKLKVCQIKSRRRRRRP